MKTPNETACPVCRKPLAGRGKCRSYEHAAIGPLEPGLILDLDGYGMAEVVSVELGATIPGGFRIVERDLTGMTPGRIRVHGTAWRYDRGSRKRIVALVDVNA